MASRNDNAGNDNGGDPVRLGVHRHELHLGGGARIILVEDVLLEGRVTSAARSSRDRTFILNVHDAILDENGEQRSPTAIAIEISRDQVRALASLVETALALHDGLASRIFG